MQIKTPNTKFITNINWDKDINGLRKVELGDFHSQNIQTTVNNVVAFNPITGTNTPATYRDTTNIIDLFLVRKRTIKLYNLWNRILNSGLMQGPTNYAMLTYKAVGSNISHIFTECLNRDGFSAWTMSSISLATDKVFYRLIRFINAAATAYYHYMTNGFLTASHFNIFPVSNYGNFSALINSNFNPTSEKFVSLMDELLDVIKSLLDETKLSSELNLTFNDLYFSTESGRNAILTLDTYNSKYNLIAKTDSSYLETNLVPQDKTLLYPQFGSVMSRNTESETWNVRNVIVDTSTYNTENNPDLNIYRKPSKIVCSQLKMDKPIKINTSQYINWNDSDDEPYVMVYNGGTFIHIPDEIKTNPQQPDNQLNIAAKFWKIGTQDTTDPKYNKQDDIKLKLDHPLNELTKFDYFDNLTLYMKLD